MRSARSGLMPGTSARSAGVRSASVSTSSSSTGLRSGKPWTPNDGSSSAISAAAARLRTRAADAGQRAAVVEPRRVLERLRDVRAQRLQVLGLDALAVEEALGHAHGAERPRAHVERLAVLDAGELHRAAAEVERHAVGQRRRVDRRQVAVEGLLLGGQDLHVERAPGAGTRRGWWRRGSPRSRPPARPRSRSRGRSARTARRSRARAPSARARARRPRRAPRRSGPARGSRRCASTTGRAPT